LVELNFTFIVFTASFIVFVGLMKLVFFDPILRVISRRESFINSNIEASKQALNKVEKEITTADPASILVNARLEASQILSNAIEEANRNKSSLVHSALQANKEMLSKNFINLEKEEAKISQNLAEHVAELTQVALDKLISEIETKKKVIA
jgi:F0F1-type ATP synthase membrane subunit b/b'